jgi:putative membrane protein
MTISLFLHDLFMTAELDCGTVHLAEQPSSIGRVARPRTLNWSPRMSRTCLAFAAAVSTLGLFGAGGLAAQDHIRTPSAEAPAPALNDATIVAIFDNANTADIETGKLAAQRGWTEEVRQFGAMLARDHEMVRQQGRDLAEKLGVTPTPPSGDQSAQELAAVIRRLSGLRGTEFDQAFLQREVQFHKDAVAAIETTLLPAIHNAELRALVVKVTPAFQAHLAMAENLLTRVATN